MKKNKYLSLFLLPSVLPLCQAKHTIPLKRNTILFYGNIPYTTETKFITENAHKYYNKIRTIKFPGIRFHTIQFNGRMGRKVFRILFKTNYCLRAEADYKYTTICSITMKMLMQQSWVQPWALGASAKSIMTVSGPGFDGSSVQTSDLHYQIMPIMTGLKTATLSQAELNKMKNSFMTHAEKTMHRTPQYVAERMLHRFIETPSTANLLQAHAFPEIRGIPSQAFNKRYANNVSLKECSEIIQDCLQAPLEIFFMDRTEPTAGDLIDALKPVWENIRPDTRYKLAQSQSGFTTKGTTTLISCYGGSLTEMVPVLAVNLGKLSPISLIAADIICTQFDLYAHPNDEASESRPTYDCVWGPCGGCALVMIQLADAPHMTSGNRVNHLGIIQNAFQCFKKNMSKSDIANNLLSSWSESLGIHQKIRDLDQWTEASPNRIEGYMEWMVDMYGFEHVFYDLTLLAYEINKEGMLHTLDQDIYDIIQDSFSEDCRRFDIWLFRGV
ncbi:hypothetical protein [Candidatus Similichlamydia laticola]|uniref:Uncharacterized protein n=1 Tax=Candidatus Similichlamydia laticola TaxID=2170265 RepID=A0A369KBK3_9BACT|nr:hypothetical protein [Candidatus Similichlamydia laticola]RDB31298.1 hypothetical protein HAT2_00599 [Candidatus Similichlamydia laticola]